MDQQRRTSLAAGIVLILLGGWFLLVRIFPDLGAWIDERISWPFFVIGAGVLLLLVGLLAGAPGLAVPATIVSGIGALLYWQNLTGNWETWAYAWTLIPGFAGLGTLLAGLLGLHPRQSFREGLRLLFISLVLFLIFGTFLGGWGQIASYWPVLLILLGLFMLLSPRFKAR